jgi:hypothetical protein
MFPSHNTHRSLYPYLLARQLKRARTSVECLLPFCDTRPPLAVSLSFGTAIRGRKILISHILYQWQWYYSKWRRLRTNSPATTYCRPVAPMPALSHLRCTEWVHITHSLSVKSESKLVSVIEREISAARACSLSLILATHCTYTMSADPTHNLS